jgi:phosphotransferase system HPr (HPr) family protein
VWDEDSGSLGPLYGMAFRRAGNALGDAADVDLPALGADAKSVLGVMGLGATSGQAVTVAAAGPDAAEAVAAIIAILGEATRVGG